MLLPESSSCLPVLLTTYARRAWDIGATLEMPDTAGWTVKHAFPSHSQHKLLQTGKVCRVALSLSNKGGGNHVSTDWRALPAQSLLLPACNSEATAQPYFSRAKTKA